MFVSRAHCRPHHQGIGDHDIKSGAERAELNESPTSLRIPDPGVRALFTEAARYQSWLDVEAALAQAQAELGVIPVAAARARALAGAITRRLAGGTLK